MNIPSRNWEKIFDQVQARNNFTSGYNLLRASQACPQFQEILAPTKCIWLFKEVFPFLLSPLEYEKREVLSMRQVCKAWRKAVDHVLENHAHYLSKLTNCSFHDDTGPYQNDSVVPFIHPLRDLRALTHLCRVEALERILQPDATGQNIFPGGGVLLHNMHATDEYKIRFYNLLTEVLLIHGDKISYLELEDSTYPAVNFKQFLFQHLLLLPNLKSLSLIFNSISDNEFSRTNTYCLALPKLPKLEALKLTNMFQADNVMPTLNVKFVKDLCLSFFPYNMHIKQFQMDGLHFPLTPFPFLKYFKPVKDYMLTDISVKLYSKQEFDHLLSLLNVISQLKSLIVYCVGGKPHWESGTQVLDKLLASLCLRHTTIQTLRVFCKIPNTVFVCYFDDLPTDTEIMMRQLRQLRRLRCFHLYGFTFMRESILPYLPPSVSCLALDCVSYPQAYGRNIRVTFCFPADLIKMHEDGKWGNCEIIDIRPKEVWGRHPQLKRISLRTIAERWNEQEDALGHLAVFRRPLFVEIVRDEGFDERLLFQIVVGVCIVFGCLNLCLFVYAFFKAKICE